MLWGLCLPGRYPAGRQAPKQRWLARGWRVREGRCRTCPRSHSSILSGRTSLSTWHTSTYVCTLDSPTRGTSENCRAARRSGSCSVACSHAGPGEGCSENIECNGGPRWLYLVQSAVDVPVYTTSADVSLPSRVGCAETAVHCAVSRAQGAADHSTAQRPTGVEHSQRAVVRGRRSVNSRDAGDVT